ncbi:hypothetical protein B0H11DRAFT_2295729 [Mycena galericulata]|nr:hypothetical protein B0H11DRAFT_2295729 [Mycena galericulata]
MCTASAKSVTLRWAPMEPVRFQQLPSGCVRDPPNHSAPLPSDSSLTLPSCGVARTADRRTSGLLPDAPDLRPHPEIPEVSLSPFGSGYNSYTKALEEGWRQERKYLKAECNEFHARVDWRLVDHEEPVLKAYDPKQPIVPETLEEADEIAKCARIKKVNLRIRRWFTYRIWRLRKYQSGLDPTKNPFAVLLAKLTGTKIPTKARQTYQQFMHESYETKIAPRVAERWEEERANDPASNVDRSKKPKGGFRALVAREVFGELPKAEQKALAARAKKEAQDEKAAYLALLKGPPSKAPEDRQKCIDRVPEFLGPILRGIQEYTGLHSVIVLGGPMPKYGGDLRTIHVSYGRAQTAAAPHFPQWDKPRFNENVLKFMTEYLSVAFTEESDAEDERHRKKRKTASTSTETPATIPTVTPASIPSDFTGWRYEQERNANIQRNKQMALAFRAQIAEELGLPPPKQNQPKALRKPKAKLPPAGPPRRSKRVSTAANAGMGGDSDPKDVDMEGGTGDGEDMSPMDDGPSGTSAGLDVDMELGNGGDGQQTASKARRVNAPPKSMNAPTPPPPPSLHAQVMSATQIPATQTGAVSETPSPGPAPMHALTASVPTATSCVSPVASTPRAATPPAKSAGPSLEAPTSTAPPAKTAAPSLEAPATTTLTAPPTKTAAPSTEAPATTTLTAPLATTATPASVSNAPKCPPKAALWFVEAHAYLTRQNLGPHFDALIAAWIRIEAASKFEQAPTILPSRGRPKQVGMWIAAARGKRGGADPKVPNPAAYEVEWKGWWESLQPAWRKKDDNGAWITEEYGEAGKEWGPLTQWGVNGTLSILMSLYFWGCAVQDTADLEATWLSAVWDVTWMLEGMATFYEKFNRKF